MITDLDASIHAHGEYARGRKRGALAAVAVTVYGHDMLALGTNPDQDWVRRHYVPRAEKAFYAGCTFSPSSD